MEAILKPKRILLIVVCLILAAGTTWVSIYLCQDSRKYRPFIYDAYSVRSIQLFSKEYGETRYVTNHEKIQAIVSLLKQFASEKPKEITVEEMDILGFPGNHITFSMMSDQTIRPSAPVLWLFPEGVMVKPHFFYAATDERYYDTWKEIFDFSRNDARFDNDVPDPYQGTETVFNFNTNEIIKIDVISAYPGSSIRTIEDAGEIRELVDKINTFRYLYSVDNIETTGGKNRLKFYTNDIEFTAVDIGNYGVCTDEICYISPLEAYEEKEWPRYFEFGK